MITNNPNFPKILMGDEEINILREVVERGEIIGNGSSRLVMGYGDDKVVKIAFDSEGKTQNETEYNTWCEYGDRGFLAEFFAMGEHIVVMERILEFDEYEVEDAVNYYYDYQEELDDNDEIDPRTIKFAEAILEIKEQLDEILGWSEDNLQLGQTPNGIKAYDYGFIPANYMESISNTLRNKVHDIGSINMIELLIQELQWEYNFKTNWEGETIRQ